MQHDIIDNRSTRLIETIQNILPGSQAARFAVGYFFVSGLEAVQHELGNVGELRLLIGSTSSRETIEQIAEGYRRLAEVEGVLEGLAYQKRAAGRLMAEETAHNLGDSLALMEQTGEAEELVSTLVRLISEGRMQVRVYTKGRLHAKAYIFDYGPIYDAQGRPMPRAEKGIAIVGSSNFTLSGITHNTELNVLVHGNENHAELVGWFDALWEEAEPFEAALMEELQSSWALADVTPYEVYLKTLYELIKDRLEGEDEQTPVWTGEILGALTDFQLRAVERAIKMIRQYGGCFVADVVGLGKSYIGAAIIKHFERTERARPLIICPASLVDQWEGYNEAYRLNARVLSMGMLRLDGVGSAGILDDPRFKERDFVLVDESHNFRNTDTQRYKVMEMFLAQGRRCVFLTATPRSKSAWDIYHQLKLFHPSDQTDIPIDPPNLREFFDQVEDGERQLPELLSHILIRRTRTHIMRWFGYDAQTHEPVDPDNYAPYRSGERRAYILVAGKPSFFPRRELHTLEYNIEETYAGLYQQIRHHLGSPDYDRGADELYYARYGLWWYVRKSRQDSPPYDELQRAGENLRGLMRISLFKRLESSVHAFRETLKKQIAIHEAFLRALDGGIVAAGEDAQQLMYEAAERDEELDLQDALEQVAGRYQIDDFDAAALRHDVAHDLDLYRRMFEMVGEINPGRDAKLQKLLETIRALGPVKCLIFTQYADTAEYLHGQIVQATGRKDVEVISSERKNRASLIYRFAPRANPALAPKGTADLSPINLLVSTDVLSEGLNLQDAQIVINYDLHWNPVRLIQRFGRIDRIGSEHDVIYGYNFLPETGLEMHLGLQERLAARIKEIHETIGEDAPVLDPAEQLNDEAMYVIYTGGSIEQFEDEEADLVGLDEAEGIIRQIQRDRPDLFKRIAGLRYGVRCARPADRRETFVFCKAGQYRQLYLLDENGELLTRDIPYILARLRCTTDERAILLPPEHNQIVSDVRRSFRGEIRQRRAESRQALSLSRGQRYVQRELSLTYSLTNDEAVRAKIEALRQVFERPLPRVILTQIGQIQKQGLSGELLVQRLLEIYEQHHLSTPDAGTGAGSSTDEVEYIVCSEAFLP